MRRSVKRSRRAIVFTILVALPPTVFVLTGTISPEAYYAVTLYGFVVGLYALVSTL